eukprot:g1927.t1
MWPLACNRQLGCFVIPRLDCDHGDEFCDVGSAKKVGAAAAGAVGLPGNHVLMDRTEQQQAAQTRSPNAKDTDAPKEKARKPSEEEERKMHQE